MNKKNPSISERGFVFKAWRCPTLLRASCPPPFGPDFVRSNRSRRQVDFHGSHGSQLRCSIPMFEQEKHKRQKIKKPLPKTAGACLFKAWRCPTLTWGDPTLPSALSSFTSEFEMGSGGSYLLLPPVKPVEEQGDETVPSLRGIS